jgi:quercetin dioxygenase-like cupin family protein
LILKTNGASDFYFQDIVVGPGGRSGWHSHPGVLMIAVKEGSIDWYDKDCVKHTYTAGQSFTENTESHNLFNTGTLNAHLLISYIIKAGAPRRIEQPQPPCGAALGLP